MNIDLNTYKNGCVHFIGCGGAGMTPMMLIMHHKGFKLSGSDMKESVNTRKLSDCGIKISIGHGKENLPENTELCLVVYSSAISDENPELAYGRSKNLKCIRRGEALVLLAETYKHSIAVSGSHGKTTVCAMLAHVLKEAGTNPGYMVGGKVNGWEYSSAPGAGDIFVTEVDESDGTHALMHPHLGIVTNVEDDHCWSVGGTEKLFNNFSSFAKQSEKLIYVKSKLTDKLFSSHYNCVELRLGDIEKITRSDWGKYQKMNAAMAVIAASECGVDPDEAIESVVKFPGVSRRMTTHLKSDNLIIIEDYAHHPTEVRAVISTLKENYPDYRLNVIFQPHRYARLERYLEDFAKELSKADLVTVVPVFAAWVEKGDVSSEDLAKLIGPHASFSGLSWQETAENVMESRCRKELIAVLGAGDIDEIIPFLIK